MKRLPVVLVLALGCGSSPRPATHSINGTSVVIVANHCSHLSKEASRQAEMTMGRLVDHCDTVVARPLTFRVLLEPNGTIGFARAPNGGSDEIPVCVVTQSLRHSIRLKTACPLDVRFEPTSIVTH